MTDPYLRYLDRPDQRNYTAFVSAYLEVMTRVARRLTASPDLAEDAVQETFLRLAASAPKRRDVSNPRAYVLRALLNSARDLARRESTRQRYERRSMPSS